MSQLRTTVYQYFQTGDIPTEAQFQFSWNSIWFKDEKFSISDTTGLENALQNKLDSTHLSDENAHQNTLAKLNASNLNNEQKEAWKTALGVGSIPDNVALVDLGEPTDVFNKDQIRTMTMMVADFVNDGKISADKIEALGLTDLIEAAENTLAAFVANTDDYEFQKNDFIAIPDVNGNHSLFMFKGGDKGILDNYLATGLSNITIPMVEGLQMALNGKLDKPASSGDFYVSKTIVDGIAYYQYKVINLQAGQIPRSFGGYIGASTLFEDNGGKIGIGTNLPTEQLQLTGRGRMRALVLDENTESLPGQITRSGTRFSATNSSGIKRDLMFGDYDGLYETFNTITTSQALILSQLLNGGSGSAGNISVNLISPPMVQNQFNSVEYVLLRGANLNLNTVSMGIQILASDKTTIVADIPNNQIQLNPNGIELVFYYNFYNFPVGQYFIKIISGAKTYITSLDMKIVQSIVDVPIGALNWEILYSADTAPNPADYAQGSSAIITTPVNGADPLTKIALKSQEIFQQWDDFYLEYTVDLSDKYTNPDNNKSTIGLGYSNVSNALINNSLVYFAYAFNWNGGIDFFNNQWQYGRNGAPVSVNVIIIKTGNLFRITTGNYTQSFTLSNNSGYSLFMSILSRTPSTARPPQTVGITITKAFKFN